MRRRLLPRPLDQPCYDTCTSIVRYSIILVLNTLIGWRAYLIPDRTSAAPESWCILVHSSQETSTCYRLSERRGHQSRTSCPTGRS